MKQFLSYVRVALIASLVGFILHVLDADFLQKWICGMPVGLSYSWGIILLAALTSVEVGVGITIIYAAIRKKILKKNIFYRGLILGVIILATKGILLRQLIMDIVVGGFSWQTWVKDSMSWVISLTLCIVLAFLYERWIANTKSENME